LVEVLEVHERCVLPLLEVAPQMDRKTVRNLVQLGFWGPGLAFMRRCEAAGITVHLFDLVPDTDSPVTEGAKGSLTWAEVGTEAGLQRILDFAASVEADAVSTVDEGSLLWLALNRSKFEPRCRIMASPASALAQLTEKARQTELAHRAGFNLLDTWLLSSQSDHALVPDSAFPICVRPTVPNSIRPHFKAEKLQTRSELERFCQTLTTWTSPLVAQPFCIGPNVILHAVRSAEGEFLAMQAFRTRRKYKGFALTIERCDLPEPAYAAARRFAELVDLNGPFHFDLLDDPKTGRLYFLEVNFRMGGTTAKIVKLGFDEPALALEAYDLQPAHTPEPLRGVTRVTSKATLIAQILSTLKSEPDDLAYPVRSRFGTCVTAIWDLIAVPDALWSFRDLTGSLRYLQRGASRAR
jgi:predicted ATP-grasp superfamily ATP-dependent carboligase